MEKYPLKVCQCCSAEWLGPPPNARIQDNGDAFSGHYWECHCGSTLFQPKLIEHKEVFDFLTHLDNDVEVDVRANLSMTGKISDLEIICAGPDAGNLMNSEYEQIRQECEYRIRERLTTAQNFVSG